MSVTLKTLTELIANMRLRLNDYDGGSYSDGDIILAINTAKHDVEYFSRCYVTTQKITLNDSTPTARYAMDNIFQAIDVDLDITGSTPFKLGKLVIPSYKDTYPIDIQANPANWIQSGYEIVLDSAPNVPGFLFVVGYGYSDDLEGSETITTIAPPVVNTILMDRAEAELRKARSTDQFNAQIALTLMQAFNAWVVNERQTNRR